MTHAPSRHCVVYPFPCYIFSFVLSSLRHRNWGIHRTDREPGGAYPLKKKLFGNVHKTPHTPHTHSYLSHSHTHVCFLKMSQRVAEAIQQLNSRVGGLHPVAAGPSKLFNHLRSARSPKHLKRGRVFRLTNLHQLQPGARALSNNRRGFLNSTVTTVAHAPSLYYWLYQRCGIPFEETKALVSSRRLKVDGVELAQEADLEYQLPWEQFQSMKVTLRVDRQQSSGNADATAVDEVDVLKRAQHRVYGLLLARPGLSISSDVANPRSFIHAVKRMSSLPNTLGAGDEASWAGMNVLRPAGFVDGVTSGIVLVTNDTSTVRYWNNEYLGNYGRFEICFGAGTPTEVVSAALEDVNKALMAIRRETQCEAATPPIPCTASLLETTTTAQPPPPPPQQHRSSSHVAVAFDGAAAVLTGSFRRRSSTAGSSSAGSSASTPPVSFRIGQRILVETPLLPYRLAQRLRANGARIVCVKQGPFQLIPSLVSHPQMFRALTTEELVAFFTFERRMKVQRMLWTLRDVDDVGRQEEVPEISAESEWKRG